MSRHFRFLSSTRRNSNLQLMSVWQPRCRRQVLIKRRHMITATKSFRKRISKVSRVAAFLMVGAAISATLAVADDRAEDDTPPAVVSPPPPEFMPMTRSERLSKYLVGMVDAQSVIRAAFSAGIAQARGTPKEWGGGGEAYGKRIANSYGQHVIRGTLQYGISAALHEDNRYFASGQVASFGEPNMPSRARCSRAT